MSYSESLLQDALIAPEGSHSDEVGWRALRFFSVYRLIIAVLFVGLFWLTELPKPLGVFDTHLFWITTHGYLMAAVAFFAPLQSRVPRFPYQVAGQVLTDILALTLIMYASAGISSGFGLLLVIAVAGGSLLKPGRIAYFFAAVATIAVLGEELYAQLVRFYPLPNYTHAAVLGITFFITAFICHALARRIQESESLAESRAVDLQNLAQLNEQIVQHMQSGVLVMDGNGKVRLFNNSARNLLGFRGDIINQPLQQISPEVDELYQAWRAEGHDSARAMRPVQDGPDIQVTFRDLTSSADSSVLAFIEDAAILRQKAQQLKLVSLGRMAASIAHEIRNPLGAISHAGQLLSESDRLVDDDRRLTTIIQDHSRRVNAIIENVMRISRRQPSEPERIDLTEWLHEFIDEFVHINNIESDAIKLHEDDAKLYVQIDPSQLHQIMVNLCSNAIRYSRLKPLVKIEAYYNDQGERVCLEVVDNGPGIPDEIAKHIFEPFVTSDIQGTGLGLYIAKELSEANQANLSLSSNTETGCRFRLTLLADISEESVA